MTDQLSMIKYAVNVIEFGYTPAMFRPVSASEIPFEAMKIALYYRLDATFNVRQDPCSLERIGRDTSLGQMSGLLALTVDPSFFSPC
ncbi:hypothetical protein N7466_007060 [Penicillium verhagenii]|uniref:uncharacterized protein n=1 Tax=Penicillium verhagenii TaxID=1562060 RepID=UPI002545AAE3|nr:uncharacterized protein N7466_007060 [Penicillium verhagenii]KAJ5928104.1 hypothetical protein N7466_007060 [Penicillium verhagenii]